MVRRYLHETDAATPQSVFYQPARSASERLNKLLNSSAFEFPKDETVLQKFIELATDKDSLVLDSFAGSGTTGHAVLKQNAEDGGTRRFILVEMDPRIARTVTAERVRRVAEGYVNAKGEAVAGLGSGFRYARLGKALFAASGHINPEITFAELARFVWFVETGAPMAQAPGASPLLGVHAGRAVYLLYNGILKDRSVAGGNVLTSALLADLPAHAGPKVVYGARCTMKPATLAAAQTTFKQLPYELKVAR